MPQPYISALDLMNQRGMQNAELMRQAQQMKLADLQYQQAQEEIANKKSLRDLLQKAIQESITKPSEGMLGYGVKMDSPQAQAFASQMTGDPEFDKANLQSINQGLEYSNKGEAVPISAPSKGGLDFSKLADSLIATGTPEGLDLGLKYKQMNQKDDKPYVVGRSLMSPTGQVLGVDTAWKEEQQQTRQQRMEELKLKLEDQRLARSDRLALQRELSQMRFDIAKQNQQNKPSPAYTLGLKELAKDDAQVSTLSNLEDSLKRWKELNANVETGPVAGRRPISFNPDYQELKRIENYLAVNNFKPGQGQISNFERELIKGAGPSTLNDNKTNSRVTDIMLGGIQNQRDRSNFREAYLQSKGTLLGSDKIWQEYLDKNPRYKTNKQGEIIPNTNRVEWVDYFGQKGSNATQHGQTALPTGWTVREKQ